MAKQSKGSSRQTVADNLERLLASGNLHQGAGAIGTTADANQTIDETLQKLQRSAISSPSEETTEIHWISIDLLLDSPYQPRQHIDTQAQEFLDLVESVKTYGFKGSLPARKHPQKEGYFQLVWGHRRREAARLAGLKTLPVVIEEYDDVKMASLAAVENVQRQDLTPLELGHLFKRMVDEGWTQVEIAQNIKKDRGYVINRLRVAEAPEDIQAFIVERPSSLRAVSYLVNVKEPEDRVLLMTLMKKGSLQTEDLSGDLDALLKDLKDRSSGIKEASPPSAALVGDDSSTKQEHSEKQETIVSTGKPAAQRDAVRVGSAKLRTILRALQGYLEDIKTRPMGPKELEIFAQIGTCYTTIDSHNRSTSVANEVQDHP
jgi:ParB family chromosome partitioning protein